MELSLDRLTKHYGNKIAVDCVSATLRPGVYGLLGANGAGKTTLMRMLCAILESTSGEVLLNGKEITSMGADYRNVLGYLPQDFGYYPNYTAMEFLMYVAALKGIPKKIAKKRAKELLEVVGLSHVANKKVKTFSGGMKQRVGIAQALLNNPGILILDEPTAGLDPKERVRFRNLLSEYAGDKIVILSSSIGILSSPNALAAYNLWCPSTTNFSPLKFIYFIGSLIPFFWMSSMSSRICFFDLLILCVGFNRIFLPATLPISAISSELP